MGCRNDALLPSTVMATAVRYRLPEAIRAAALHEPEDWWGLQRHHGAYRRERDLLARPWEAVSVLWRTPDVTLASVQDYRSGLPGPQEHVWGATLGPEAHVFANHPANSATHSAARPNFWAGNRILPRAAQEGGALLAVYRIRPLTPWVHARLVPDTALRPVARAVHGRPRGSATAMSLWPPKGAAGYSNVVRRPARSYARPGRGVAWVCQVGRRATHGSFAEFVEGLHEPEFGPSVRHVTPDGRELELGLEGRFRVDGRPRLLDGFHIRNPFTDTAPDAERMTITVGSRRHTLDLIRPHRG